MLLLQPWTKNKGTLTRSLKINPHTFEFAEQL